MTGCCGELIELLETIERTKAEIYKLKYRFNESSDPQERYRLKHKLKELRKLQFQQIKQLG
jgi:hypothetical protein